MWAIAVSLLQHGMRYDWHGHSNANDFGNAHPYLKWLVKPFAVCQENIQPMSMCFCVPEEWLMRGSLAPMYFTKTCWESCVCLSAAIKAVNGHL